MKLKNSIHTLGLSSLIAFSLAAPLHAVVANKTVTLGEPVVGAKLIGHFHDIITQSTYTAHMSGEAKARLLGAEFTVAKGESNFAVDGTKNSRAWGYFETAGYFLTPWIDKSWNETFQNTRSFSTQRLTLLSVGGKQTFWAGPVPVTVSGSVSVQLWAEGTVAAGIQYGKPVVRANIGPAAEATAYASAALGGYGVELGVKGKMRLCRARFMAATELVPTSSRVDVKYGSQLLIDGPSGSLAVYAKLGWGFFSTEKSYTFATFPGETYNYTVAATKTIPFQ